MNRAGRALARAWRRGRRLPHGGNVRSFTDRPIATADLDQILEAGRRSPSSQNWQPWDFILVTDREQLRALAGVWRGAGHVAESAATIAIIGPAADNEFHRAQLDLGQATDGDDAGRRRSRHRQLPRGRC